MTVDWMSGGVAQNDRDEARSAARNPLPQHREHPYGCRCLPCSIDESGMQPGTYGADS